MTDILEMDLEEKRGLRREARANSRELKREQRARERELVAPLPIQKGQWQYSAAAISITDPDRYPSVMGVIPYQFFQVAKSQTKFTQNFKKAAEALGEICYFGSLVGGHPVVGDMDDAKKKQTRKFHWRGEDLDSSTEKPFRLNVRVNYDDFYEDYITNELLVRPREYIRLKDNLYTLGYKFDREIKLKNRAQAFCLSGSVAKAVCFGLIPTKIIEDSNEPSVFQAHYEQAFGYLDSRLGELKEGWIVESTQGKGVKVDLFVTALIEEEGEVRFKFYDFKSPVNKTLTNNLEKMIHSKRNAWKRKSVS